MIRKKYFIYIIVVITIFFSLYYYFNFHRNYLFLKKCPIDSFLCLNSKTIKTKITKVVGFKINKNKPFYAMADGKLMKVFIEGKNNKSAGYMLTTTSNQVIFYKFPFDTKTIENQENNFVKKGQVIGQIKSDQIDENYKNVNLVIGIIKSNNDLKFLNLTSRDIWGL